MTIALCIHLNVRAFFLQLKLHRCTSDRSKIERQRLKSIRGGATLNLCQQKTYFLFGGAGQHSFLKEIHVLRTISNEGIRSSSFGFSYGSVQNWRKGRVITTAKRQALCKWLNKDAASHLVKGVKVSPEHFDDTMSLQGFAGLFQGGREFLNSQLPVSEETGGEGSQHVKLELPEAIVNAFSVFMFDKDRVERKKSDDGIDNLSRLKGFYAVFLEPISRSFEGKLLRGYIEIQERINVSERFIWLPVKLRLPFLPDASDKATFRHYSGFMYPNGEFFHWVFDLTLTESYDMIYMITDKEWLFGDGQMGGTYLSVTAERPSMHGSNDCAVCSLGDGIDAEVISRVEPESCILALDQLNGELVDPATHKVCSPDKMLEAIQGKKNK